MGAYVAEHCLNHKLKGVEGAYNRHDDFEERRRALEAWEQLLRAVETCRKAATRRAGGGVLG